MRTSFFQSKPGLRVISMVVLSSMVTTLAWARPMSLTVPAL